MAVMDNRYLYVIIFLLIILISYLKTKNIVSPIIIFNSIWTFIFLCAINNNLVTQASNSTYFLFFIGVLCMDLGCSISSCIKYKKIKLINRRINIAYGEQYEIRKWLLYVFICISIIYYFTNLIIIYKNIESFNLSDVMQSANSEYVLTKRYRIVNFLYTMIINPTSYIIPFIVASDYWMGNRDKKLLLISLIMLLLRLLSSGNRMSFLYFFIFIIIVGLLKIKIDTYKVKDKILRRKKKKFFFLCFILISVSAIIFVFSSISRGYNALSNVFINFAIPLRMFEIWGEEILNSGEYGYGYSSFQGIIYPIFYLLKNSIGLPLPSHISSVFTIVTRTITEWVFGGTYLHNAYVTIFWYFYYDFRIVGVVILSLIIGILSQRAYMRALICQNIKATAIYCAYIRVLIGSYGDMAFSNVGFGVGFLFILFIVFKRKNKL